MPDIYSGACWNALMEEETKESLARLYMDNLRHSRDLEKSIHGLQEKISTLQTRCIRSPEPKIEDATFFSIEGFDDDLFPWHREDVIRFFDRNSAEDAMKFLQYLGVVPEDACVCKHSVFERDAEFSSQ